MDFKAFVRKREEMRRFWLFRPSIAKTKSGFDPNQPRDEIGRWADTGRGRLRAAGGPPRRVKGAKMGSALRRKPKGFTIQQAERAAQADIRNAAKETGISEEAVIAKTEKRLQEDLAQPLAIRRGRRGALSIATDERFKTQFETGTSGGNFNPERRARSEAIGLGTPKDSPVAQRAVYGYFKTKHHEASNYGGVEFILKDSVKERTTYTLGDSEAGFSRGLQVGGKSPKDKGAWNGYASSYSATERSMALGVTYIEAQIQGGVSLKDVAEVVIHASPQNARSWYGDTMDALKAKGIKVRIDEETV